jgi:hypothetical protein
MEKFSTIREAINSQEKSFSEFLQVLDKAGKFKDWLVGQNPDAQLLESYYQSAVAGSWIEGLPAKTFRYVFASVLGFASIPAGLAAGAADEFLVDKLIKGWRPNQFVEGQLKKFLPPK